MDNFHQRVCNYPLCNYSAELMVTINVTSIDIESRSQNKQSLIAVVFLLPYLNSLSKLNHKLHVVTQYICILIAIIYYKPLNLSPIIHLSITSKSSSHIECSQYKDLSATEFKTFFSRYNEQVNYIQQRCTLKFWYGKQNMIPL